MNTVELKLLHPIYNIEYLALYRNYCLFIEEKLECRFLIKEYRILTIETIRLGINQNKFEDISQKFSF